MRTISELDPKDLWRYFEEINAIPRASKKEEAIVQYLMVFGKKHHLETQRDEVGNVVIRKPATEGKENRQVVILQSHVDMVHQKNADTDFDFSVQGIEMYVDGDVVRAKGTTLGADNGIGVATSLALLSADNMEHPAIEALFTIDEETGMTGAKALQPDFVKGKLLINLDTEEDDEITIGCAGGIDITASGAYNKNLIEGKITFLQISIGGLKGGHSGIDIHRGLGNANKLLIRLLHGVTQGSLAHIVEIDGGGLRNAIPREAKAHAVVLSEQKEGVQNILEAIREEIALEYASLEPNLAISFSFEDDFEGVYGVMETSFQQHLVAALYAVHDGVFRMSPAISGLVETSNNLARVKVRDGKYEVMCLTRSSVDSSKRNLAIAIQSVFELLGATVVLSGNYPGWTPNPDSKLLHVAKEVYRQNFGDDAKIYACHAGLECGLISEKYPDLDMISIGPTIRRAHSPDEHVYISSVQKFWKYFTSLLERTP